MITIAGMASKSKTLRQIKKTIIIPYAFLLPTMIIFGVFVFYPFFRTIVTSLCLTNASGKIIKFVGLDNYIWLFKSKHFWNSVGVSFKFAFLISAPTFFISFVLALMANNRARGSRIYETFYSIPMAIASAPAAAIWFLIYSSGSGILNYVFNTNIRWLQDRNIAIYSVALVTIWMNLGVNFIFLLTGLRNVPDELIDCSILDGANYFRKLFNVIIPLASPQIFFVIFLNITTSFRSFAQIKLMTQGGPAYSTNILVYNIYRTAFQDNQFYRACALSFILFLIIFIITRIQFALEKKGVHYN